MVFDAYGELTSYIRTKSKLTDYSRFHFMLHEVKPWCSIAGNLTPSPKKKKSSKPCILSSTQVFPTPRACNDHGNSKPSNEDHTVGIRA